MKRIVFSLLVAGIATFALIPSAQAAPCPAPSTQRADYSYRPSDQGWHRSSDHRWRALVRARRAFYRHWRGNSWERARFERWYARRCAELRHRHW